MTPDLKILADNRNDMLLAEVAAWLHDMGKCSDEMITLTAWDKPTDFQYKYKTAFSSLVGTHTIKIFDEEIQFDEKIQLKELIEKGKPEAAKEESTEPWLIQMLGRCHAAAHIEKEEPLSKEEKQDLEKKIKNKKKEIDRKRNGANKKREQAAKLENEGKGDPEKLRKEAISMEAEASTLQAEVDLLFLRIKQVHQPKDNTMLSSPFGFEIRKISELTDILRSLPYDKIETKQQEMISATCELFKNALGDTRRPINEVTLTDWSSIVAALYKSALAGALLGKYLFSWNEIPGNDDGRLIESLKQKYSIDWVTTAKIEKIDDGKAINVSSEKNFLSLRLNQEKTKVKLKIGDDRTDEFTAKTENGKLNIYLGNKPEPNKLKWRLLAIRFDSEQILGDASKIPVLLERKKWLTDGLDRVKTLLEETYPLGNEVYRDENGSIFVVPNIDNLLEIKNSGNGKTLKELISEKLGYDGEIVVTPVLSGNWWGQDTERKDNDEIPPIAEILKEKPYSPPDPEKVKKWWENIENTEICTISWLRPQGHKEGFGRKASDYWVERAKKVESRAEEWLKNRDSTIWIDEVADSNGRICLIVGKFGIEDWLSPDGYIKTLLVKPPDGNPDTDPTKTPSFARIRRIWETTKQFWEDVEQDFKETIGTVDARLKIIVKPFKGSNHFSKNSAYEAELEGIRFAVFYAEKNEFIIIENLQRLAKKMGASSEKLDNFNETIEYIKNNLHDKTLKIYDSEGKNREKHIGHLAVSQVAPELTSYIPAVPILSEPSIFMAIVPADRALEIAKHIKEKYETELGKVRNRLPITIGMVFAKSHTPLAALMDAGRRMLKLPAEDAEEKDWVLNGDAEDCDKDCILNFDNGITWQIPVKMGDNITEDIWYPYFYVNGLHANRSTAFEGPKGWLVHVKELKKGDEIKITPSKFDFEFLDTASRRFEVSYDDKGKRRDTTKSERPYLLEELEDFIRLWNILSEKLGRSQIKNVIGLIETKREEWLQEDGKDIFEKFIHDVLHNANWKNGIPANIGELEKAAISGKLKDIVELNMDILKIKEEKQEEVSK